MLEFNAPDVLSEVRACCEAYERALVANDVAALQGFFWDSAHAIRFGMGEQLYGAEAISAFRQARVINFSERKIVRFELLGLGRDCAVSMLEFTSTVNGRPVQGRQTQVWARIPETGWRVTSAHVSHAGGPGEAWERFLDGASAAVGIPVAAAHRPGVLAHLVTTSGIATPLMAFPIPTDAELAPVFTP